MNMNGWAKRLVGLIAAIVLAASTSVYVSGCSNDEEILRDRDSVYEMGYSLFSDLQS